jgi:hypothetical protein
MVNYLHSGWAYFTLMIIVFTIGYHLSGLVSGRSYNFKVDFRLALFTLIVTGIQVVLGIANYFTSAVWDHIMENGFGSVMKVSELRLAALEHPLMGFAGLLFMLYGFRRMYYQPVPERKFFSIAMFYSVGLILFLSRIPWGKWL